MLWAGGVVPLADRGDPYVGFAGHAPLFVESTAADGRRVYTTAPSKLEWFNPQRFPVHKNDGVTRIFCLGGSTTYGRPYDDRTSFCGWLRAFLPVVDPGTRWEVVNAGGISYASYRVVRVMEELAHYEPDLFVVYTGHNEFLEARTYEQLRALPETIRDLASLAARLRLYAVLTDLAGSGRDVLSAEVDAILDNAVGPEDYERDDQMRAAVLEHFGDSLERMVQRGRRAGARLIFVTPASNIGDFTPFKAEPSAHLSAAQIARVRRLKADARQALADGDPERAARMTRQAVALDPRDADALYLRGQALLAVGHPEDARQALVAARDEDIAPLRAPTPIPEIVAETARDAGAGLTDFTRLVRERAPDEVPGEELFLDHVHPTIDLNRDLALAIIDEMIEMGAVTPDAGWNADAAARTEERVRAGVDEDAQVMALTNLSKVLDWAGKQEEAARLVDRALSMAGDDGHAVVQKAVVLVRAGRLQEALPYSERALQLMPNVADVHRSHGVLLAELGRNAEALQELQTALRLDPELPDTYYHLALVRAQLGDAAGAERAYRKALAQDPDHASAANNLGILLARRGDVETALAWFEHALGADPEHADAAANRARARRMLDR